MTLTPAKGTSLYILEDQGVLFNEASQELYILNTTSTFIWCHMEDELGETSIISELKHTFGLSTLEAEQYLSKSLDNWQKLGVLEGTERPETTGLEGIAAMEPNKKHYHLIGSPNLSRAIGTDY